MSLSYCFFVTFPFFVYKRVWDEVKWYWRRCWVGGRLLLLVLHCGLGFGCLLMFCFWVAVYFSLLVGFGFKSGGLEEFAVRFSLFNVV